MLAVRMDREAVRDAYDVQIRQRLVDDTGRGVVERDAHVVRVIPDGPGWAGITWFDLDDADVDEVIAAQIRCFPAGRAWEWKHYSYDRPGDLPDRLRAAGFVPEPPETLLVAEIAELDLDVPPPAGVDLMPVTDADGVAELISVHEAVFGGDYSGLGARLTAMLVHEPPAAAAVIARAADGTPVCGGRVEFHPGTEFASIWGGGTLPDWRGRGVFRAVVAYRAALAAARGFRYLQVDALPASRPILERLGFVALAETTPYVHPGRAVG